MLSNLEIRDIAWKRLFGGGWFWRLLGGSLLLGMFMQVVQSIFSAFFQIVGGVTWAMHLQAILENSRDLVTPIPNLNSGMIVLMSAGTIFEIFLSLLLGAIVSYGTAALLLRCLDDDPRDWIVEIFKGVMMPFGLLALNARFVLIFLGWMVLAFIPFAAVVGLVIAVFQPFAAGADSLASAIALSVGVSIASLPAICIYLIPFYRYRFLYLVKAAHPDWTAGACLEHCRELMKNKMMRSFRLDCSYWKPITLALLPLLIASSLALFSTIFAESASRETAIAVVGFAAFVGLVCVILALGALLVVSHYISVGQGILYRILESEINQ